jgi:hypothetical protein
MLAGLVANVAAWKTMAEANARLPEDQKFSWWWWTLSKYVRLWKEHKRLCPESHWRLYMMLSFVACIVFMILIAASA